MFETVVATVLVVVAPAFPGGTELSDEQAPLRLTEEARLAALAAPDSPGMLTEDPPPPADNDAPPPAFGTRNTWRMGVWAGAGAASQADIDTWMVIGGLTFSYFVLDDFSLNFEVNGIYVDQRFATSAAGGNLAMLFRWHFLSRESWSTYIDAGAGVAWFTDPVPADGTNGNFSPQAGFGATFKVDERDTRLFVGMRWLHYSNGSLAASNPGIDNFIGYMGVNWAF